MAFTQNFKPFYDPRNDKQQSDCSENDIHSHLKNQQIHRAPVDIGDKVQEGWEPYVHKRGDLFYVEVSDDSRKQGTGHKSYNEEDSSLERIHHEQTSCNHDKEDLSLERMQSQQIGFINNQNSEHQDRKYRDQSEENNNKSEIIIKGANYKHFKPKILFSDQSITQDNFKSEHSVKYNFQQNTKNRNLSHKESYKNDSQQKTKNRNLTHKDSYRSDHSDGHDSQQNVKNRNLTHKDSYRSDHIDGHDSQRNAKNRNLTHKDSYRSDHSDGNDSIQNAQSKHLTHRDSYEGDPSTELDSKHNLKNRHLSHSNISGPSTDKIKHVYMVPNLRNCTANDTTGIVLCEKLFGIVLCQYNHKSQQPHLNGNTLEKLARERKIIVQDVLQASPALKSGQIFRGDMLLCLNDMDISWVNLDEVFRSISSKPVKLTFQDPVVIGPNQIPTSRAPPPVPPKSYPHKISTCSIVPTLSQMPNQQQKKKRPQLGENLLQLVSGEDKTKLSSFLKNILCCVLYLTLDSPECDSSVETGKEDIVYQFPYNHSNTLIDVRGLFLTLCGSVPDATSSKAVKCCTVSHNTQVIHVVFMKEGQDLFLIGLPRSRVPLAYCEVVMQEMERLLMVLFGSVTSAFRLPKNRVQLDQLFSLMLHTVLQNPDIIQHGPTSSFTARILYESISGAKYLSLSQDNKLLCDEILSEFEAADFDEFLDDDELDERRAFSVLGTCLYYKEYLLCSHLPSSDFQDVHLFIKYHSLLQLMTKKSVEELVIWREVYPTRRCVNPPPSPPGYSEPKGRWFLLLVGMKHFLLGTLLEIGGCTKSQNVRSSPDPFYVSQAKATLLQFQTDDVAMAQCCEKRLTTESGGPSLVNADCVLSGIKPKKEDTLVLSPTKLQESPKNLATTILSPLNSLFFKWPPLYDSQSIASLPEEIELNRDLSTPVMKRQGSRLSYGSNDSGGSGSSSGVHNKQGKQNSKSGSVLEVNSINHMPISTLPTIKVTGGACNTLFHHIQFDSVEGVYISPSPQNMAASQGNLHTQLLFSFYKSCLQLRKSLHDSQHEKQKTGHTKHGNSLSFAKEQGLLFQYVQNQENKKPPITMMYWVVGRMLHQGREVYVCFHESVPQNVVEVAFSLNFGT